MKAFAVIGANYGDEGKGLMTDFLCDKHNVELVIRHNGGAQAGHTVNVAGKRHVFSHFGSGAFAGVPTLLSKFFVCNPILFRIELEKLHRLGISPRVDVDSRAPVTLPVDMLINQAVEIKRGANRHGSCGVGFSETLERNLNVDFHFNVLELFNYPGTMKDAIEDIVELWVPRRVKTLGIQDIWESKFKHILEPVMKRFLEDVQVFKDYINLRDTSYIQNRCTILFEGAQGLALDQNSPDFPHVTRSNTGLKNVYELINDYACPLQVDQLEAVYVTRAYLTRHGAGPLSGELSAAPYSKVNETTNVQHDFQGHFRYAHLDVMGLSQRIALDQQNAPAYVTTSLAVTCMDQLDDQVTIANENENLIVARDELLNTIQQTTKLKVKFSSNGPSREDIAVYE